MRIEVFGLRINKRRLSIEDWRLSIEVFRLRIDGCRLSIEERRLSIEDLRLSIEVRALQCPLGGPSYEERTDYQRISRKWSKNDSWTAWREQEFNAKAQKREVAGKTTLLCALAAWRLGVKFRSPVCIN